MLVRCLSWLLPALFFSSAYANAFALDPIQVSTKHKALLAKSPYWHALLHMKAGSPMINDPQFLLSSDQFSPAEELLKTIALFQSEPKEAACRFPARLFWLSQQFSQPLTSDAFAHCAELTDYLKHVPFEQLSLVFTSEVLSSASSMMGHVFIKADGMNYRGTKVEHAVSFFTEYETVNPIKIIADGLWRGMSGFFIVRPYEKERSRYLIKEERNVFEYSLQLNADERRLMQLHMWELKDRDIRYLFQNYNCATLTLYVLGVARPDIKSSEALFVSPADVIKAASTADMVDGANVNLANEWAISALELQLGLTRTEQLRGLLRTNDVINSLNTTNLSELDIEYIQSLARHQSFSNTMSQQDKQYIQSLGNEGKALILNSNVAKNPLTTIQDTVLSARFDNTVRGRELNLSFLPASHYLRTTNPQFFSDSQLNIGQFDFTYNVDEEELRLNQLTLYSYQSYVPTTDTLPRNSGAIFIGYKQHMSDGFEQTGLLTFEGGWGKSYRLDRDIIVYGLGHAGGATRWSDGFWLAKLSTGMIVNLAWQSKLRIHSEVQWTTKTENSFKGLEFELSNQLSPDMGVFLRSKRLSTHGQHEWQSSVGFDWYF